MPQEVTPPGAWTDVSGLLTALPDVLLVATTGARIVRAEGAVEILFGLAPAEVVGTSLFDHLHPDDLAALRLPWRVHASRPGSRTSFDWRILHRNGAWRDVGVASHHWSDAGGRGELVLALRDATEQVRTRRQEALERRNLEDAVTQLQATVGTLEEATAWAQQMAGRAMMESVARGAHLARMSHEIRTPLNGIFGTLDLLADSEFAPEQRDLVLTSLRAGEAMLDLVNEILDYAKLEADTVELESIPFDPREVVEEAVSVFAGRAEAAGLELGLDVSTQVPDRLRGDPARLRQMLMNLIGNALKFTERGEVFVTMEGAASAPRPEEVVEPGAPPGRSAQIVLSVRDTGLGIPKSDQGRIFEAFRQADASTRRRFGGTGLGLAITRRLTEAMGGSIDLVSAPGRGSTFRIRLDLPVEESEAAALSLPGEMTILVFVESAAVRESVCRRLETWGARALAAANGTEARRWLERADGETPAPDLILLDTRADGERWVPWAESRPRPEAGRPAPIVLLAGLSLRAPREQLEDLGVLRVIYRPVRGGQLHGAIVEAMRPAGCEERPREGAQVESTTVLSGRVLVVDDDSINQIVGCRLLQSLGLETEVARDGAEAIARVEAEKFDLILMDRWMPRIDGVEATRRIRALETDRARTPILAVTGDLTDEAREECRQAGMDDLLAKPLRTRALRAAVERWLPAGREGAEVRKAA